MVFIYVNLIAATSISELSKDINGANENKIRIFLHIQTNNVDSDSKGRAFESHRAYQSSKIRTPFPMGTAFGFFSFLEQCKTKGTAAAVPFSVLLSAARSDRRVSVCTARDFFVKARSGGPACSSMAGEGGEACQSSGWMSSYRPERSSAANAKLSSGRASLRMPDRPSSPGRWQSEPAVMIRPCFSA